MSKLPKWQRAHVAKCRAAFGIGRQDFEFRATRTDALDGCIAEATTEARYERAAITIVRGLERGPQGYEVLTHECLHAATGAQRQAVNRIIELVPAALRDHAEALWQDGNEASITRIARGLTPLLRATAWKKRGDE